MIPINELRIGNWVKYYCDPKTAGCDCDEPNIDFQHEIEMLDDEGNVSLGHITVSEIINEELFGIEITRDVLKEFGFKEITQTLDNGRNWKEYEYVLATFYSLGKISTCEDFCFEFKVRHKNKTKQIVISYGAISFKIKYVHDLQNIVFFNTGIELERNRNLQNFDINCTDLIPKGKVLLRPKNYTDLIPEGKVLLRPKNYNE